MVLECLNLSFSSSLREEAEVHRPTSKRGEGLLFDISNTINHTITLFESMRVLNIPLQRHVPDL
jgi:hypothetical protein